MWSVAPESMTHMEEDEIRRVGFTLLDECSDRSRCKLK